MTETKLWTPAERIKRPSGLVYTKVADDDPRWARLREPFPAAQVGHKPQPWCRACVDSPRKVCDNHQKRNCPVCRQNITVAHIDLDYVGHAAVTQRLLEVDPHWEWRPMTKAEIEEHNYPAPGELGMWIWLFVLDQVRPGLGETEGGQLRGANSIKARMSDAIKNASMRYGVAIETWSKEDLADKRAAEAEAAEAPQQQAKAEEEAQNAAGWLKQVGEATTATQLTALYDAIRKANLYKGELKTALLAKRREILAKDAGKTTISDDGATTEQPAGESS